jgi:hypothetical protein
MDKKKKGLADEGDGDFILNETGTSINVDKPVDENRNVDPQKKVNNQEEPYMPPVADEQKDITD